VLDCADGYQTENQEENDIIEESCQRQGGASEEAGAEEETFQEIGEEAGPPGQNHGEQEAFPEDGSESDPPKGGRR
jgi:hypothetical protein